MEMKWDKVPMSVRRVRAIKPGGRWGHSVNAVDNGRLLYVFGGYSSDGGDEDYPVNDVYVFDTTSNTWSRPKTKGAPPTPRDSHTCTLVGKHLFVFGGTNGHEPMNDLHILDTLSHQWSSPPMTGEIPSPREGHGAALINKFLCIFGGIGMYVEEGIPKEKSMNDLYILDTRSFHWTRAETSGTSPAPRSGHTCSPYKNMLVVWGGVDEFNVYFDDVRVLNTETMLWKELLTVGEKPVPRAGHATVAFGKHLLVFGGFMDAESLTNDVHVLNIESGVWEKPSMRGEAPPPRFSVAGALTDLEKGLILFIGGCNQTLHPMSDMFSLDTVSCLANDVDKAEDVDIDDHDVSEPAVHDHEEMVRPEDCQVPFLSGFFTDIGEGEFLSREMPGASSGTQNQMDHQDTASDIESRFFNAKVTHVFHYGYQIRANVNGNSLRGLLFSNNPSHCEAVRRSLLKKKSGQRRIRRLKSK